MPNTILCTIDLSASSKHTVKWALQMAQQLNMHLTILYTYRLLQSNGEAVMMKRKTEEKAATAFAEIEKEMLTGKGVTYDFKTEVGFVSDRIEDHARKHKLDFLVMDKKMSTSNKENFEELVEQIKVPLLIVP